MVKLHFNAFHMNEGPLVEFRNVIFFASGTFVLGLALGCSGSAGKGSGAPAATVASGDAPQSGERQIEAPPKSSDSEEALCPGGLINDPLFRQYREIGITIEIDCPALIGSNSRGYQYKPSDLAETLKVLDRSYALFREWPNRPAKIVIGESAYHSSKNNLIQIPFAISRPHDLEDYLHDTRFLMDLEISEFGRDIRISYVHYHFARQGDGALVERGTEDVLGYGVEREELVKGDIARVKKLSRFIKKMPYKNVRLTHANRMGSFIVSRWNDSYTLPTEYSDEQLMPYFKYLNRLSQIQKMFGEITVTVSVPAYSGLKIGLAIQALDILASVKGTIEGLKVKSVYVPEADLNTIQRRFAIERRNNSLTIENLFNYDEKPHTAAQLKACLEKASFEVQSTYYCDGLGPYRY